MRTIKVISKNDELRLSYNAPYILQSFEFEAGVNIYNSKGMLQDGATYEGNTLDVRAITLTITLVGQSSEDLRRMIRRVKGVFNPKLGEVEIIEGDRKIKCIASDVPYFLNKKNTSAVGIISLIAHNPYYQDLQEMRALVASWIPSFEFPLDIPPSGIDMGYREPSLIANVLNDGDVDTGMRIVFKANATVTNPQLLNINTGEYFKINKVLLAGERVVVTTYFQNKKVQFVKDGVYTTLNDWDFTSTFLQLEVGDNLFRYDATDGLDNLELDIYYTQKYLGV